MSEWREVKVSELGRILTGKTPKTSISEYYGGSIPFITPSDDMSVKYIYTTAKTLTEEGAMSVKNNIIPKGTICVSCIGSDLGKVVIATKESVTNQQINSVIVNDKEFDIDFVYYAMLILGKVLNHNSKTSTAVPIVNKSQFSGYTVLCPDLGEQKKVSSILAAIDAKIENNNAINRNLEQQAQALYKAWFIDFEPFNGFMPTEWRTSTLGEVSLMGAGGDKPQIVSDIKSEECPFPIYSNGISDEGLYGFTDKPKISEESVTVSARGTIGFVCLRHVPYVPIVRLITLIPDTSLITAKYLYLYLKQINIAGTGTTQQQLTVPDFRKTKIIVPTKELCEKFTEIIDPLYYRIWHNQDENIKLSNLRDTLLPRLMSGELDVSELELE